MNLEEARKRIPELNGLSDESAVNVIHEVYYPDMDKAALAGRLGYKMAPPPAPERSAARAVGDLGLQFAGGAVSGVRMMADIAGAGNKVSGTLRTAEEALREWQSAAAKADQARVAEILKEAEDKGFGDQVMAGIRAFGVAPGAMMAQAAGTSLPTLATAAIPGVGPAAVAARLGTAGVMGAVQGAGNIKGVIYEDVKRALTAEGKFTPEEIEAKAVEAQSYSGENSGQIALGGALGAAAGSTGMERTVAALRSGVTTAAPGILARVGTGALTEAVPEMAQGGQEKYASNLALGNEGFVVDPLSGVVAGATVEGLAGGVMGGALGLPNPTVVGSGPPVNPAAPPPNGPLSRAAQKAPAPVIVTPPPAPAAPAPDQAAALLAFANERARQIEEKAKGTKDQKVTGPDGKPTTVPGRQPEFLTPDEKAERDFLKASGGDAAKLAQAYPELVASLPTAQPAGESLTEADANAVLDRMDRNASRELASLREWDQRPAEPVAATAASVAPAARAPMPTMQPGDILNKEDLPFTTRLSASNVQKKQGGELVEVFGGWVVRPAAAQQPIQATPDVTPEAAQPAALVDTPAAADAAGIDAVPPAQAQPQGALSDGQAQEESAGRPVPVAAAKAPAVEAPASAGGDGAVAPAVVPAAPGAGAVEADGVATKLPALLAGAKPRYSYGPKAFELTFDSDLDRAAYVIAQEKTSSRDADYLKFVMDATGMDEAGARAYGAQVRDSIKAQAKDAEPGALKVPQVDREAVRNTQIADAPAAATPKKPPFVSKEDGERLFGVDVKRQAAIDRIAKGTAYFGTPEKARDFITKSGIKDTHEAVTVKPGRVEVRAKAGAITPPNQANNPGQSPSTTPPNQAANPGEDGEITPPKETAIDRRNRLIAERAEQPAAAKADSGPFGPILTQYRGDAQGAIKALTQLQDGEAVAALNHPEVGDIDLVWGEEGTSNSDGLGLAKLIKWHPEVLADLQGFLSGLRKDEATSGENRIRLVGKDGRAVVRLQWSGIAKTWLLTAFEGASKGSTMTDTGANDAGDDTTSPNPERIESVSLPAKGAQVKGGAEAGTTMDTASNGSKGDTARLGPDANSSVTAPQVDAKPKKPKAIADRDAKLLAARADYFTPGNIVQGYSGFDEVLAYEATEGGGFKVTVHEVKKVGDEWHRVGKPQDRRQHSTLPESRQIAAGPVARLGYTPAAEVVYTSPRSDGQPFPNAVDRGTAPAAPASAPESDRGALDGFVAASDPTMDLRKLSRAKKQDGDIELGNDKFVTLEQAMAAARASMTEKEWGMPFQFNRVLDIAPVDWNRMVESMTGKAYRDPTRGAAPAAAPAPAAPSGYVLFTGPQEGGFPLVIDREAMMRSRLANEQKRLIQPGMSQEIADAFTASGLKEARESFDAQGKFVGDRFQVTVPTRGVYLFGTKTEALEFAEITGMPKGRKRVMTAAPAPAAAPAANPGDALQARMRADIAEQREAEAAGAAAYQANADRMPPEEMQKPSLRAKWLQGYDNAAPAAASPAPKPAPAVSANTIFTEDAAEKARARLKAKLGRLNSGVDPEMLMDGITLAGYHIEKGARTFAAFARAMVDDLGEGVRPFLKSWYMAVSFDPRAAQFAGDMTPVGEVASADVDSLGKPDAPAASPVPATAGRTPAESLYNAITSGNMPKDNPALKKLVEAFDGKPADQARMKQGQEELETAIVMRARDIVAEQNGDRSTYDALLRLYESQPNLNIRTSTSIANQAYSTPAPLAYLASRLAGITRTTVTHEPTAGTGMLLIGSDPERAIVNELNDARIEALKAQGFAPTQKDAATQMLVPVDSKPDAVVTNPPFGSIKDADGKPVKVKVDGFSLGQIDHLIAARALDAMKEDGRATLILGANKVAGGLSTDDRIFFNWLYSHYNVAGHFEVEGDLYTRQGAGWPVRVITINGRQKSSKISPVAGTVQRVDNWDQVYEQFTESLKAAESARVAPDAAGRRAPATADALVSTDKGRPAGGTRGDGNVAGTPARDLRNREDVLPEGVGASADEQRLNGQPFVPQPQRGQGNATSAGPTKPAGNAAVDGAVAPQGNEFQSPYTPRSSRKDEGVLIPANMAQPTQDALSRLEDEVGDIDEFARTELGYRSVQDLHNALMGLQVDSVAMAIYQIKKSKAVVIADQTGIGKGRQAASVIRWAARQGMVPVFVSVKPSLFTDMYGDLADIGTSDVNPFIMNSDAWVAGEGGAKLFANKAATHKRSLEQIAATGELPDGSNALFMTYSQINTNNTQRQALMALAPNAVFVLDESHNAAGESATGQFMIDTLGLAKGVTYLSATYAKRPDNMPLYFKTDIGEAAADTDGLAAAMASGGLPLQTVVSNNLVKAGQMFRRERSYDGVSIASVFDSPNRALHERMSNEATKALRAIVAADRMFHSVYVKELADQLAATGATVKDSAGNQLEAGVQHTEFSSVVHNFVKQMLLGLKAQSAADEAVASLKRGEKPIIAVENTMGSFLNEYVAVNGIAQGESLGAFDYRTVLSRALERSRVIIEVTPGGDKVPRQVSMAMLDAETRAEYEAAQEVIDGLTLEIPVSPIDWMRAEITRAGFNVAEITGRNLSVDYTNPKKPVLSAIDTQEQKDKVDTTRRFNSGKLDALILNVAGSTGISLHASEKFEDQRQRHMIVAQAAGDINIFMQMLGRVHRTGQVRLPKYTILSVDLPTEKRPTAVLSIKMKSLNANTSSNTESATSVKTADILNKYGDQIVNQYLRDNYQLARALGLEREISDEPSDDIARKATGRLALQPIETQMSFYEDVETQYSGLIDYLNKTNQNDLEPRTFDFDAKEVRQEVLFDGPNKETPFGEDAIYGEYSIKAQGTPMKPEEIRATMAENLGDSTPAAYTRKMLDDLDVKFNAYYASLDDAAKDAASSVRSIGRDFLSRHAIGSTFRVDINSEPFNAVVMNVRNAHKETGNPYSMSKIQLTVAVNGALRSLSVPATQFAKIEVSSIAPGFKIEALFREQPPNQRETAKIVTGNLLAAYGELQGVRGTIITFTKQDGTSEQGILLPKLFDYSKNTRGDYRLADGAAALKFLQQSENKDIGRFGIMTRDGVVRVLPSAQGVRVQVPKSKLKGGKYFLDKALIAAAGDFVSAGNFMTATVQTPADAVKVLDLLMKKQALYVLPSMADEAKQLTGDKAKPESDSGGVPVFSSVRQASSTQAKLSKDAVVQAVATALNRVPGGPNIRVVANPGEIGLSVPTSIVPKGVTLPDGTVFVFSDYAESSVDVFATVFHELFHRGSKVRFTSNPDYITAMLEIAAADPFVQREVDAWKASPDGQDKRAEFAGKGPMTGERLANFEALAVEEALATMAEKVAQGELRNPQTALKQLARFLSRVANKWGMTRLALWLNTRSQSQAERFILETVGMSGGKANISTNALLFRSGNMANQIRQFDVAGKPAGWLAHYRGIALQALGRRQLVDLYTDELPQLASYNELVQRMEAEKNDTGAEADEVATEWGKLDSDTKKPGEEQRLAELMHDATLAQIDPQKDYQAGDNRAAWAGLRSKFNALDPKSQALYQKARDMYAEHYAQVRQAIADRIERSDMSGSQKKAVIARMDEDFFKKTKGVYFPLARFGNYVVLVKDADGEVVSVNRAETLNEANTTRGELAKAFPRAEGFAVSKVLKDAEFNPGRDAVGKGFMADLFNVLDKQGADEALRDSVSQLYLSSLPDLSWAKHGIHRKGTPGFSQDARRAFAQNMFHGARHLAKLRYADQMQSELEAMQENIGAYSEVEEYDSVKAQQVVDEMVKRHESLMNPKVNSLSTALTSVGFVFYLGISPAAAMVNLSQTALVAYPIMGAKWGFAKAGAALLRASKETVAAKNDLSKLLSGDDLAAFNQAVKDGTIDVTMAHDLAGISQGEDQKVAWAMRPAMRAASFLFHHAERFNRQATFIASFRLSKEAGADNKTAFEEAKKATYDGHFDYGAANRPRVMQGNVAKVVLLFKQYGQNMVYTLSRQAYLSMKGMTPEDRKAARKQLGGILAMHAAAAGALGLPLVGVLLQAASFIGGDEDEPWDAEVAMKNAMADAFGPKAAEVMAHGLSRLTPWDISSRVALDRLILPDVQEGLEGQKWAEALMVQAIGPVGGIFTGAAKGLQSMSEGKYGRGLEEMMPVALRNPIKALRYAEEGSVDKSGVVIKDEVSLAGVLGQASGFAPSEVRLATEGKSAIYNHDKARMERRQSLMAQYAQARMAEDEEGAQEAREAIAKFNAKNPTRRILPKNLAQSIRNRQRRIDEADQGVYLPKNRRDSYEAARFSVTD